MSGSVDTKKYNPRAHGALCDQCPLNGSKAVSPSGPFDASSAFVVDGPDMHAVNKGEFLVGPAGAKFGEMLYRLGVQRSQIYLTSVLLCRAEVPGLEGKKKYELKTYIAWFRKQNAMRKKNGWPVQLNPIECCRPRLLKELAGLEGGALSRGAPNGLVVTPMGNFALEATTKKDPQSSKIPKGILRYRGSVIPIEGGLS